jgi:hypothetical protein
MNYITNDVIRKDRSELSNNKKQEQNNYTENKDVNILEKFSVYYTIFLIRQILYFNFNFLNLYFIPLVVKLQ